MSTRRHLYVKFIGLLSLSACAPLPPGQVATSSTSRYQQPITTAGAQSVDSYFGAAYAAEKAHNYVEAMQLFQKIANDSSSAGSRAMADTHIGSFYEKGLGTNQDYRQAAYWYQKAVNLHAAATGAELRLGLLYANGLGVPRDRAKARELFEAAGPSSSIYLVLLDTNKLPSNSDDISPALMREALAEKQQREEREQAQQEAEYAREAATAARKPTASQSSSSSSTEKDPVNRAGCNWMLGTSYWNVFSPCN
jgi:Sel1 repeat